jgi:2-polyprenyl-6-hydroxyphenyl methylase/3-demethylubiquinone-9 3-methyltransferase
LTHTTLSTAPKPVGTGSVATPDADARFAFGKNWLRYLTLIDDDRIRAAERSIRELLGISDLEGRSFLDIGSGSGLFSLAARRLGARVHSFDYDPDSVRCTAELRRRYRSDDSAWIVERGSILDTNYVRSLGTFDVVYSWGVLHHTGAMRDALAHAGALVAPGGTLAIAIYNDQGNWSHRWRAVKRLYCSGALGKAIVCASCIPAFVARGLVSDLAGARNPVARYRDYRRNRGMSVLHDWIDWLGGYPFEVARPEEIFDYFRERGFELRRLKTCGGTVGCNEYVFQCRGMPGDA